MVVEAWRLLSILLKDDFFLCERKGKKGSFDKQIEPNLFS